MVTDTKYYDLLGVTPDATLEEIKKAYRRQSMKYHPDRTDGDPDKEALFISIKKAYEVLSDAVAREKYDENGVSAGNTSTQLEAKAILSTMFVMAIDNMINQSQSTTVRFNISNILTTIKDIHESVRKNEAKLTLEVQLIKKQHDKIMQFIDVVEFDGNGENLFHKVISDKFRASESSIKSLEHQLEVNDEVQAMLKHYSDKPEEVIVSVEFKPEPIENDVSPTWRP